MLSVAPGSQERELFLIILYNINSKGHVSGWLVFQTLILCHHHHSSFLMLSKLAIRILVLHAMQSSQRISVIPLTRRSSET